MNPQRPLPARPVIGGHCHRAGPTFQTDPLPNSAFAAFRLSAQSPFGFITLTPGTTGAFPETNCSRNSDCRTLTPAEEQRGANRFPRAMVRKIAGSIRRPVGSGRGGEAAEFFHKQIIEPPQRRFQIHPCLRELGSSCGITCSNPPPPRTSRRARRLGDGGARTLR